jgi:hypothetical protein
LGDNNIIAILFLRYNVEDLLQAYRKSRSGRDGADVLANVDEMCRGLRDYFNSTLIYQLLYQAERRQYAELLSGNPGVSMSKFYGPIHLLR